MNGWRDKGIELTSEDVTARHEPTNGKRKPTHKRDVFHAWMLEGLDFSRPWDMPKLEAVDAHPTALVPFSVAMHEGWDDYECFVHFFEDDFRFERVWKEPRRYLPKLSKFEGVIMPDLSTCIDFPSRSKCGTLTATSCLALGSKNRVL